MPLCQWHQRLLLGRSFLSRTPTLCGGRRRSDLCRNISSAVFIFQTPLCQNYHHQEKLWIRRASPASRARWISIYNIMSSRSGRCGRSQRLLRHREGGVLLMQQRFASDDKNYRRSKFIYENYLLVCIGIATVYCGLYKSESSSYLIH